MNQKTENESQSEKNDRPARNTGRSRNERTELPTVDKNNTNSPKKSKAKAPNKGVKKQGVPGRLGGNVSKTSPATESLNLPGISDEMAARAGIRKVGALEAKDLCGLEVNGLWIPYFDRNGEPVLVDGKPYGRLGMDRPGVSKKYHQHEDSGVHAYFPSGVKLNTGSIVLVEGEKKGLALQDQGIASIGISGFHGFQRKEDEKQRLLDELDFLGIYNGQEGLEFLGDNDTTLNHQFADAVIQLMDRLGKQPETSGVMVTLPRIPFGEQKGVDDLIQKWLDEGLDPKTEYQKLERVTISLKEDGGKRGAADLRWKLLKVELDRDREGLKALVESSAKEAERLFKLIVRMKDAAISQKAAKDAIRDLLGMEKREFNAALKQAQDSLSAGVSDSPNADGETVPECIERVVGSGYNYSGGKYLYPDLNGNYTDYSREELKSHLRMFEGLSAKAGPNAPDGLPPVEEALIEIKAKPRLYHFGPVAGHPAGLHKRGENEFLVTAGPTIPKGVVGSCMSGAVSIGAFSGVLKRGV